MHGTRQQLPYLRFTRRQDFVRSPVKLLWSPRRCQGVPFSPTCQHLVHIYIYIVYIYIHTYIYIYIYISYASGFSGDGRYERSSSIRVIIISSSIINTIVIIIITIIIIIIISSSSSNITSQASPGTGATSVARCRRLRSRRGGQARVSNESYTYIYIYIHI